jgi:hypothetical protein
LTLLTPILLDTFEAVREVMSVRLFGGKYTSRFNLLLSRYCRFSEQYHSLRQRVKDYVGGAESNVNVLFDDLYAQYSSYEEV